MSESFNITPPEVAPEGGERSFGQRTEFAEQYDIPFQKDYRRIEAIIPDPNDRDVISRAERIKWNDTGILQRVSPTADDPYSIFLANQFVMDGIKYLGTANPILASSITTAEEAMAALPEIMATTRDHEITERIVEALYSGVFSGEIPTLAPTNELQERSLSFLNTNAEPVTVSAVMMSLAGLDPGGKDALLAQIMDYWNRTDMTQADAEQNFVIWQYQQAVSRQQFDYSTRGVWGAVAEWATQPFRATSAIGRNIWAQAASPQDAWYRSHLSLGQNLSISLGQEAGSSQAQLTSGIFDGVMNVVLDPVAWVANAAAAVKMTRVLPLVAEGSKFKLAAQAFIPVRGANNLKLPWGTRSLTSRLTYVARSKRIDDFVASVPQTVKQAAIATDSPAKLAEMFPQWRRAVGFLEVMASRVKTEEQFDYVLKLGLTGGLSGDADTTLGITQRIAIMRDKVTKLLKRETAADAVDPEAQIYRVTNNDYGVFAPIPDNARDVSTSGWGGKASPARLREVLDDFDANASGNITDEALQWWGDFEGDQPAAVHEAARIMREGGFDANSDPAEVAAYLATEQAQLVANTMWVPSMGTLHGVDPSTGKIRIPSATTQTASSDARNLSLTPREILEVDEAQRALSAAALAHMPDEIIVFRVGDVRTGVRHTGHFTFDPNYDYPAELGGLPKTDTQFRAYRVKKSKVRLTRAGNADREAEALISYADVEEIPGFVKESRARGTTSAIDLEDSRVIVQDFFAGHEGIARFQPGREAFTIEVEGTTYRVFYGESTWANYRTTDILVTDPSGRMVLGSVDEGGKSKLWVDPAVRGKGMLRQVIEEIDDTGMLLEESHRKSGLGEYQHVIDELGARSNDVAVPAGRSLNLLDGMAGFSSRPGVWTVTVGPGPLSPAKKAEQVGYSASDAAGLRQDIMRGASSMDWGWAFPSQQDQNFVRDAQDALSSGVITLDEFADMVITRYLKNDMDTNLTGVRATRAHRVRYEPSQLHLNDNTRKVILADNAKVVDLRDQKTVEGMVAAGLDPNSRTDIAEYAATRMGADVAIDQTGGLIVYNNEKTLMGFDYQDDLANLSPEIQAALAEYITERAGVTNVLRQGPEAFIINDMPTKVRYGRQIIDDPEFYKPRRFSGGSTSKSWWVRAAKARVFGKFPPDKINIADVRAGRDGLERALRYYGVDDLQIRGMLDRFTDATFMNRYKVVQEIITEAAEAIEHPLVKLGLIEFVNRQGIRGFGLGPDGQEVLMTSSRTNPLGESAKPFLFSHLASEVHLPDPVGFSKSLRRYKWSKTVGPGWITKGARDTTTAKRKAIVSRMKASVKAKHGDEVVAGISNDEWLAMAYASVGPGSIGDNAYGSVAHMANTVHNAWRWVVSAFSISMLAFRPVAWGGRVFLDETSRAMFADMPSMLRNPVRAISGIWDAAAAQKANLYKQQNVDWAQAVLKTLRPHLEKNDPVTLVKEASKIIPDLLPRIADSGDEVAKWSASRIYFLVADLLNDAAIKNDFGSISAKAPSLRQQRRYSRSIRVLNEIGVDITQRNKDFGWGDNVPEMLQAGWAQQYGLEWKVRPVTHAVGQMTQDSIAEVARVYQRNLELLAGDVTARAAMRTLARRAAGQPDDPHDIWQIMGNQNYGRLNEEILRWANDKGYETINEAALVQRYMDEIIAPYVDHVLDPLLSKDPALRSAQLLEIADTRKLVTEGGDTLDLHKTSKGLSEMETLIERLDGEGTKVPDLYGLFSPSAWSNERPDNWWPAVRDFPSKIIQVFGDDATQALVRRPAYLHRFKNEKKYRMALGLSEREAEAMAHVAAFESVNHVMYNLQNATPFLKSMNQVIPFFTAFWEITSTWGWKIPMMQGGLGIGHAQVVRKIDRYFDAMRELGIVEYDETGSYRLAVDTQADKGKVVGDPLSRQLATLIRNPLIATEHFFNLGHALKDDMSFSSFAEAWDRDGFTAVPTKYTFALSTPYDIENYGIGSAIDISISPQPFLQLGLSSLRQRLPFAASYKTENFDGVTLAEAAAKGQIDPMRLMAYNDDILREKLGSETVDMLRTNRLSLSSVNLEDIDLRMPNTGVFATFINEVFFPFGDLENASDTIAQFGPQWLKFAFRSFGLWEEGSEEDGFLGLHTANLDDNVTSSAVIGAYRHLYATEGIGEHTDKLRSDFYALATPYLQNGRAEFNDDGSLKWIGERPADANAVDTAYHALDDFVEGTMLRAIEVASSTLAMRSMLAFILPGTPRTFFEEEHALDPYYQAQAIQRGGTPDLLNSDIDSIMQYVQALAADPSGGRAMRLFLDNHPELGPYLIGKSYWEPGGQPPLDREMDNYFRDQNDGLRSTLSPDVYQHLHLVRQNENARQVAFIEVFGNDPFEAAAASLRDPQLYQDTMLEFNERREMLAWEDELNGSPYLTWKDRNRSDAFNIIEESQRSFRDWENSLNDVMQLAEADPSMNPQQLKETTSTLKRLRAGLRETMEEFRSADSDISWMQPSQRARLLYFQEVYSVYLDQLGEQYDRLDAASTNEETRPIWNQIARIKDAWDEMDITLSSAPHVTFPSPTEFQQENKNPILQDHAVDKAVLYPATFFDHRTVTNVTERYPVLRDYLPVTPFQRDVYDWYIDWTETISERYNNGIGEISYKEYQNQKKNLQNEFDRRRAENGMGPHIMYENLWDVQKMHIAGALPPSWQRYDLVARINAVQQLRARDGYASVGKDDPGRKAVLGEIWRIIETDPVFRQELMELGERMYGKALPDAFLNQFLFNDGR